MTKEQKLEAFIDQIGLRNFRGKELTWLWSRSRGGVVNSCPPENLWQNIVQPLVVLDEIRTRLGVPIRITSAYRSPAYNDAVGGEKMSYHKIFMALDFTCGPGPVRAAQIARNIRGSRLRIPSGGAFVWKGGIGEYPSFVHIDTRGKNADW